MGAFALIILILLALIILGPVLKLVAAITFGLIVSVFLWMLAGMFAGRLIRGRGYGPTGDVLLGLAGGLVGSIVLGFLGIEAVGSVPLVGGILVGIIGAVILVWLIRLFGNRDFAA